MIGVDLVRPLEPDWQQTLDTVGRANGWPTSRDPKALGREVSRLSAAYNDSGCAHAAMRDAAAARLAFAFVRDAPKAAGAVRELLVTQVLRPDGVLRLLDVGAGLGASTWGVYRALRVMHPDAEIEATWLEPDDAAIAVGRQVLELRRQGGRAPGLQVAAHARRSDQLSGMGRFDLVVLGNVLSELEVTAPAAAREAAHSEALAGLLKDHLRPGGAVVVVEPALRERTRHLHRVRDALVRQGAFVFAPCLHQGRCPALVSDGDWCHEDLSVDLPAWLVPVAREAGLRFQGLTFSYVVLRSEGPGLRDLLPAHRAGSRLRVVSQPLATKGKTEIYLCGEFGGMADRKRVSRLKRDEKAPRGEDEPRWAELTRGDILDISPPLACADGLRVGRDAHIRLANRRE